MSRIVQVREVRGPSRNQSPSVTYKVIILGNSGVGKTCMTCAFGDGAFPQIEPETTIGVDFKEKTLKIDGDIVNVRALHYSPPPPPPPPLLHLEKTFL